MTSRGPFQHKLLHHCESFPVIPLQHLVSKKWNWCCCALCWLRYHTSTRSVGWKLGLPLIRADLGLASLKAKKSGITPLIAVKSPYYRKHMRSASSICFRITLFLFLLNVFVSLARIPHPAFLREIIFNYIACCR